MAPGEFTQIKKKIEVSDILTANEKKEWLYLLPKMTLEQIKELDRILSIKLPTLKGSIPSPASPAGLATPKPLETLKQIADILPPKPSRSPSSNSISSLTVTDLRKSPSIYVFAQELHQKIKDLVENRKLPREEVLSAFKQSPLYRAYLTDGLKILNNEQPVILSREELEAMIELREALKKIAY